MNCVSNSISTNVSTNAITLENAWQFSILPREMFIEIIKNCDHKTKSSLSLVSKDLRIYVLNSERIAKENQLKTIYFRVLAVFKPDNQNNAAALPPSLLEKCGYFLWNSSNYIQAIKACEKISNPYFLVYICEFLLSDLHKNKKLHEMQTLLPVIAHYENEISGNILKIVVTYAIEKCFFMEAQWLNSRIDDEEIRHYNKKRLFDKYFELKKFDDAAQILIEMPNWLSYSSGYLVYEPISRFYLPSEMIMMCKVAWVYYHNKDNIAAQQMLFQAKEKALKYELNYKIGSLLTIGDIFLKMGFLDFGHKLFAETETFLTSLTTKDDYFFGNIEELYAKTPGNYYEFLIHKIKELIHQEITCNKGFASNIRAFIPILFRIEKCSTTKLEIFQEVLQAALKAQDYLRSPPYSTQIFRDRKQTDDLLISLSLNIFRKDSKEANKIASSIHATFTRISIQCFLADALMEKGQHQEGDEIFQEVIEQLRTMEKIPEDQATDILVPLGENEYFDAFIENLEKAKRQSGYLIGRVIANQAEKGNHVNAKLLLNHLNRGNPIFYTSYLLAIAKGIYRNSTWDERDDIHNDPIKDAIDLTDLAKSLVVPYIEDNISKSYLIDIAKTKAKIGDVQGALQILIDVRQQIKNECKNFLTDEQQMNLMKIAKLQNSLHDYGEVMKTIDIFQLNPNAHNAYVEALMMLGK